MGEKEIKNYIKTHWFPEHKATLTQQGDLQVLNWRKPGTCVYAVKFIFDGEYMYISGDIGEAVFRLTWKVGVHTFNGISTHYFIEKMRSFSDDIYDFSKKEAEKELQEWKQQYLEYNCDIENKELKKFNDFFDELIYDLQDCTEEWEWASVINSKSYEISEYDPDYWEWMYRIGRKVPNRIYGYIVALQMASKQLKEQEKIREMKYYVSICNVMENCQECTKHLNSDLIPCNYMRKKYGESIWKYKDKYKNYLI